MKLRNWIILLVVVAIGIAAYFYWQQSTQSSAASQIQTVAVTRGNISAIVGATGTVRPNQSALLNWQTTGTVEQVFFRAGDVVKRDDILANIENTSLPQNVILAEAELLVAQRALEDLQNSTLSQAQATLVLAQAEKALVDAQSKVQGVNFQRASDTKIENVQSQLDLINQQIAQARKFYALFDKLPDGDSRKATALANLTSLELQRDTLVAQLNYITGRPDNNEVQQRVASYEIAKAQLADAQLRVERLKDGPDVVELARAQAQITAALATLKQARIAAPFAGTITQVEPLPGDQVSPGKLAFRLDDLSHLLLDVQVSEIDINSISLNQPVTLSFDAILGTTYNGKVVEVSPVGNSVQGTVEFTVTVELLDPDAAVKPGMTAAVNILTRQLDDVILVPNRAVRFVDGERVVYVLRNGEQLAVKIRLGASDDINSELIGGDLQVGDLIILNPTTVFTGGGGPPMGRGGN